jgi:hypothetical protein
MRWDGRSVWVCLPPAQSALRADSKSGYLYPYPRPRIRGNCFNINHKK